MMRVVDQGACLEFGKGDSCKDPVHCRERVEIPVMGFGMMVWRIGGLSRCRLQCSHGEKVCLRAANEQCKTVLIAKRCGQDAALTEEARPKLSMCSATPLSPLWLQMHRIPEPRAPLYSPIMRRTSQSRDRKGLWQCSGNRATGFDVTVTGTLLQHDGQEGVSSPTEVGPAQIYDLSRRGPNFCGYNRSRSIRPDAGVKRRHGLGDSYCQTPIATWTVLTVRSAF